MYYINVNMAANNVVIADEELGGAWSCYGSYKSFEEAEKELERLQRDTKELLVLHNAPEDKYRVVEYMLGDGPVSQFSGYTVIGSAEDYRQAEEIMTEFEVMQLLRGVDVDADREEKLYEGIVDYLLSEDGYMFSWHVANGDVPPQDQISELPDRDWFMSEEGLDWIYQYV